MKRSVESVSITRQYHHGLHRICGCVWLSLLGGDHGLSFLSNYKTGLRGGAPSYLLSHWPLHSISRMLWAKYYKTTWAKYWQFKLAGVSGLVQCYWQCLVTPCYVLSSLRQGNTYQQEICSIHGEINRSRSNYPEPKSGCVHFDNDNNIIMNNGNSKYLRLTTQQAWL